MPNQNPQNKRINAGAVLNKIVPILFILALPFAAKSQTQEITKILNKELKAELKKQFSSSIFNGDTIVLIHAFAINANKILSVEIKKMLGSGEGYMVEKQSVPLNKVMNVGKDINVIIGTKDKDVSVTWSYFYNDGRRETNNTKTNLFFTYIHFPNNEHIGNNLLNAFKTAGYNIQKYYWYD